MGADDLILDDDPGQKSPTAGAFEVSDPTPSDRAAGIAAELKRQADARTDPQPFERLPPHDMEAEAAVLGGCLSDTRALTSTLQMLREEDFFKSAHRLVLRACQQMVNMELPVDLVTIQSRLQDMGQLDAVGGAMYLASLSEKVASPGNVEAYAHIVRDKAQLRQLLAALQASMADVYARQNESSLVIDAASERIISVADNHVENFHQVGTGWEAHAEDLARASRGEKQLGMLTPIAGWNRILGGILPGKVYLIAGRPGEGKSTLAVNLAMGLVNKNIPAAFFSLEMDVDQIRDRIVAAMVELDGSRIEKGQMAAHEMDLYRGALQTLKAHPLHIYHDPFMQFQQLMAKARQAITKMRCKVLFIDYMQMLHDDSQRWNTRAAELTHICRQLAAFARKHHIALVEVAQLNRDLKEGQEPQVAHLKESGGLEEAADVVAMLYDKKEEKYAGQAVAPVELIIGKQRGGDRGRLELQHHRHFLKFECPF